MVHMGYEKSDKISTVGPWGGDGTINWDDGVYDGVNVITLEYGKCIHSIQVIYHKNDMEVPGKRHIIDGGIPPSGHAQIVLQPNEKLTTVTGHYSPLSGYYTKYPIMRSLTFKTNKRTFGPYGVEEGNPFSADFEGGKIVGFMGNSGWYLNAIGFHVALA